MGHMREAYRSMFGDIHWRALAAVWILSLLVVGALAAMDAPVVIFWIVVGGAAAGVALSMVGEAFTSVLPMSRSKASDASTPPSSETH